MRHALCRTFGPLIALAAQIREMRTMKARVKGNRDGKQDYD
jgi:hypothetical protein